MKTIGVVAVLKREIITPATGEPSYIHQTNSEVTRFSGACSIESVHAFMMAKHPGAIAIEVYKPETDPLAQKRH